MDTTGPSAHPAGFSGCFCWEPRLWSAHLASPMSKCHAETGAHAKDKVNTMSHPLPTRNCAAAAGVHDPTLNIRRMEPQGVSEPISQGPVSVCHTAAFHLSDREACQGVGHRKTG